MDSKWKFKPLNLESTDKNVAAGELFWLSTVRSFLSLQQIYSKRYFQHIKMRAIRLSFLRKNQKNPQKDPDEMEKKIDTIKFKADLILKEAVAKNKRSFEKNNAIIASVIKKEYTTEKEEFRQKVKIQIEILKKENEDLEDLCSKKERGNKELLDSLRTTLENSSSWISFVLLLGEDFLVLASKHRYFTRESCKEKTLQMKDTSDNADILRLACLMYHAGNQLNEQAFINNLDCWNQYTNLLTNPSQTTFEEIHEANCKLALVTRQFELELLQEASATKESLQREQRLMSKIKLLNYHLPTYKVREAALMFTKEAV